MNSARRVPELDLLRAAVVAGVLLFHAVHVFDPLDFYVKSDAEWEPLVPVILFCGLWGMPLLFVFAGVGIWHSLGSRSPREFVRERVARLLVPFVAGVVLLVPPQLHAERAMAGIDGSYGDTLREFFTVRGELDFPIPLEGSGAVGEFEPAHLWFLAYLLVFSVVLLPLLWRLRRVSLARWASPGIVLAAGIPIALLEAALGSEDTGGWHRSVYMVVLLYGFLLAGEPALRAALARAARPAAWAGLAGFAVLAGVGLVFEPDELLYGHSATAIAWRAGKGFVGWLLLLAAVALAGRLRLRAAPAVVAYARDAVLPVYVLHQTVVVLGAWWIVGWDVPAGVQLLALVVLTVVGTLGLYELLRRIPGAGVLLGQRKRSSSSARTSAIAPGPSSAVT
jgi:glucan biosynthesis protein C